MGRLWIAALAALALGCGSPDSEPPLTQSGPSLPTGYVKAAACRDCHIEIRNSYQTTGMGRSFELPTS